MSAASPASDDDLATVARICMVNSQIRPNRVNDPRILAAMRRIPREGFVPAARRHMAYLDEDVPLGHDRFLMEPMVLARMLKAANPRDGERALVVAAGAGYGAAVLDACGCKVFALEEDPDLIRLAREVLPREAPNVTLVTGPLADGWAAEAPFDLIVIEGAVPEVPAALTGQLAPVTGRLLTVLDTGAGITQAVIGEMTAAGLRTCPLFDCGTPLLPSLRKAPVFEF
ncbi:MAG TPA: protein-L-isoaspartate O-methyltransferase [Rhodopila sp.]|nr:protein-L-isoaspartate O-methyltransferase [Rhodopila sp.]